MSRIVRLSLFLLVIAVVIRGLYPSVLHVKGVLELDGKPLPKIPETLTATRDYFKKGVAVTNGAGTAVKYVDIERSITDIPVRKDVFKSDSGTKTEIVAETSEEEAKKQTEASFPTILFHGITTKNRVRGAYITVTSIPGYSSDIAFAPVNAFVRHGTVVAGWKVEKITEREITFRRDDVIKSISKGRSPLVNVNIFGNGVAPK